MSTAETPEGEIDVFTVSDREDAERLRGTVDSLLDSIGKHEKSLATSYARLGSLLLKVRSKGYWIEWGYDSWGSYIDDMRNRIGRQRSQIYAFISIAETLLPAISESDLEEMGATKANELRRFVKQSGLRVPDEILKQALDPHTKTAELHVTVLEALHEKGEVKGRWFEFSGFYATADERAELEQAVHLAKAIDPVIPHDWPEHHQRKEVLLRWAREFYSSNIGMVDEF